MLTLPMEAALAVSHLQLPDFLLAPPIMCVPTPLTVPEQDTENNVPSILGGVVLPPSPITTATFITRCKLAVNVG